MSKFSVYFNSGPIQLHLKNDQGNYTVTVPADCALISNTGEVLSFYGLESKDVYMYVEGDSTKADIPKYLMDAAIFLGQSGVGAAVGNKQFGIPGGIAGGLLGLFTAENSREWIKKQLPKAKDRIRQGYYCSQKWCFDGPLILR